MESLSCLISYVPVEIEMKRIPPFRSFCYLDSFVADGGAFGSRISRDSSLYKLLIYDDHTV